MKSVNRKRSAFTLIEMMVVVAIIGILIAGVFRLVSAAGENAKRAKTIAVIQRVQNALSGFYAEYGTYPPVAQHSSPDPYVEANAESGKEEKTSQLKSENACRAARAQPVAFEFPNPKSMDDYINMLYKDQGIMSVNQQLGQVAATLTKYQWQDVKIFKFGMLSFLLPRVELMGGADLADGNDSDNTPNMKFFNSLQWQKNNTGTLKAIRERENRAVSRWLPNLEKTLYGGMIVMGVNLSEDTTDETPDPTFFGSGQYPNGSSGGNKYVLQGMTIHDGWGRELYYFSAPPYQSYRIWSAGQNGITFPPWISQEALSTKDRETVNAWVEDDLVFFDR